MSIVIPAAVQVPINPFAGVAGPSVQLALQQIAAGASGGTVTSMSVTTANGVSGVVANPTTTPAVTITLDAITPTSVAASGTVTGSNLSGANTGDQVASTVPMTPFSGVAGPSTQQALQQIAAASLGGTVTSVSVTTANGVSGVVATATTTPAVTLTLGDITPSSVVSSANAGALPSPPAGVTPRLRLAGADGTNTLSMLIDGFGFGPTIYMRRADGTNASKSALASGVGFFNLQGIGYGATAYSGNAANITFNASEAWTDAAQGCEIRLATTPIGSTSRATALTVTNTAVTAAGALAGSNLSGTNTGDQNLFRTIAVAGQSDIVADSTTDTLTVANGANITVTTNAGTDTLTIAAGAAGEAPNGQVVVFGVASGPGAGTWTIQRWLPFVVDGVTYRIPCFAT